MVISGVTESVRKVFHLEPGSFWYGFSVASALLGTFIGALFAGVPGDRYGSRDALKVVGFMYVVSALGCAFCWNLESFYVFRFIGGLAIGASSVLAPVYISEIAPAERRGSAHGSVPVQHRVRHPAGVRRAMRWCSSSSAARTRGA